ncbi:MAG: response regulator [Oscillospiraceae bacterium]|nr:response regulator [Oscillospiraceae bacterium]
MSNKRSVIILVDDNPTNLTIGRTMLSTFYQVIPAPSAFAMFETLKKVVPDLILLDIDMPEMNGYEAIEGLKADERFKDIPVIFLTGLDSADSEVQGLDLGAVDYVTKPFSAPMLLKRIERELLLVERERDLLNTQAELRYNLKNMEALVHEKANTVIQLQNAVFDTVVDMVEFRDEYTGGHIMRTQQYVKVLLDEMIEEGVYAKEIADWDISNILSSAKLHDVGKIAVSDVILRKNAKLTAEEFETMKVHVTASVDAIERIIAKTGEEEFFIHAIRMAGTHHEKWDGSGYPMGLRGQNIPLEGRLMAVADVYDALISKRQYKEAFTHEEACRIIEESSGTQFDPALVDVFKNTEKVFEQIALGNAI